MELLVSMGHVSSSQVEWNKSKESKVEYIRLRF